MRKLTNTKELHMDAMSPLRGDLYDSLAFLINSTGNSDGKKDTLVYVVPFHRNERVPEGDLDWQPWETAMNDGVFDSDPSKDHGYETPRVYGWLKNIWADDTFKAWKQLTIDKVASETREPAARAEFAKIEAEFKTVFATLTNDERANLHSRM